MKNKILILALIALLPSCKMARTVISINSGGLDKQSSSNKIDSLISKSETFVCYNKDDKFIVNPSNEIEYAVYKMVSIPKIKSNVDYKAPKTAYKPQKTKKEKKKKVKRDRRTKRTNYEKDKSKREKPHYSYVGISKSFYKINVSNLIFDIIAIPMIIPTFGSSVSWINSIRQRDYFIGKKCNHDGKCTGIEHSIKKTVLIETNVRVKNDEIKDSIRIIENLPEAYRVDNINIIKKLGKFQLSDVKHEVKTVNGKSYHQFTLIPIKSFTKNCRVWIKLKVTITPGKQDYVPQSDAG